MARRPTFKQRVFSKIRLPAHPEGCWLWTGQPNNYGYGQIERGGRASRKNRMAHIVVWQFYNGPVPEGKELDHICQNRLCVSPAHLRPATRSENNQNRKGANKNSKSGTLGVDWRPDTSKWRAQITVNRRNISLGYFADLEDAKAARRAAELKYHPFTPEHRASA